VRRASFEDEDLFFAHIAGMDSYAHGLKAAAKLIEERVLDDFIDQRYSSFKEGIGADIVSGKATLKSLEAYALQNKPIKNASGRLEQLRAVLNEAIFSV